MASKETDQSITRPTAVIETEGTSLKAALDVARKFGVVRDTVLPFATGKLYPGQSSTFYAIAAQRKILAYFNLGTNLSNWRTWLATKGPILTRLNVDERGTSRATTPATSTSTSRRRREEATRWRSSATVRAPSSSATAGGRAGATRASPTRRPAYAQDAFTEAYGVEV